jgi:Spy/CpxP family protein refolding chaperone
MEHFFFPMTMTASKWKISLYGLAIFLAGGVAGWVSATHIVPRSAPGLQRMAAHWCWELQKRMNLTPAQVDKVQPIIEAGMRSFRSGMEAQMLTGMTNCNDQIREVLTPEQKVTFVQIESEQVQFIRDRFGEKPKKDETNSVPASLK